MPRINTITPNATTVDPRDVLYLERYQSGGSTTDPSSNTYKTAPIFADDFLAALGLKIVEVALNLDHTVLAAEKGRTFVVDAHIAAKTITVPRSLGSPTDVFRFWVRRDLVNDSTAKDILIIDDAGTLIGAIMSTDPVNIEFRVNGSVVTRVGISA